MTNRKTEFLTKLRALLEEYDVFIVACYEGDTHGIDDEHIAILHRLGKGSLLEEEWLRIDHRIYLTATDLPATAPGAAPKLDLAPSTDSCSGRQEW